ncbi:MAG: hypothetical protein HY291_05260 [Planctomycetes bacterium]|nr:hypothetical protein [Planctomycetota bacterium]
MHTHEPRTEVMPFEPERRQDVAPQPKRRLGNSAVLLAGVVVGLLAGAVGVGYALAAGRSDTPGMKEEVYLEYRVDPQNEHVKWADTFSAPDTFLIVRFQSEPETVYVTPVVDDDPGFPNPERFSVPRAFVPGEKAYVYLMDDDSASNKFWKDLTQKALKNGGAIVGHVANAWTLGSVPKEQVIAFCDQAGDKVGEMTLDANDCLAWADFSVRSVPLSFDADGGKAETNFTDCDGNPAGTLKAVFGHR